MKPYVYIIQNKEHTHWYVGYKQKPKAGEDYWGSSDYLDELIAQTGKDQWTKTIIKEFDTWQEAKAHEDKLLELLWDLPGRVNKAVNGFVDHNDPQVKEKHKASCQKRSENPEWIANHKAGCKIGAQKRVENPESVANHKAAVQKRSEDPEWIANNTSANKKRAKPFIATSIDTGEEFYCEKLRCEQAKTLELNPSAVSSCLNGKYKQHKGYTFRYA